MGPHLLCMTDPFVTDMIEGRALDAASRRSEELDMLQVPTVADGGNLSQEGEDPVISTRLVGAGWTEFH